MSEEVKGTGDIKWYLKPVSVIIALLCVGPLALPLVWITPAWKRWQKAVIILATLIFTFLGVQASVKLYQILKDEMDQLKALLQQ